MLLNQKLILLINLFLYTLVYNQKNGLFIYFVIFFILKLYDGIIHFYTPYWLLFNLDCFFYNSAQLAYLNGMPILTAFQ